MARTKLNQPIHVIKGKVLIRSSRPSQITVPQGEIRFQAGLHELIIDDEALTLRTLKGSKAILETADVMRSTQPGWTLVSILSGGFSMIKGEVQR